MPDLLVEIGTEELPAGRLRAAGEALRDSLSARLQEEGLLQEGPASPVLATPRRLAAFVAGVRPRQEDREERVWGPPVKAAFAPDGTPTKAGSGFAASVGMDLDAMGRGEKVAGKPEYLYADRRIEGRSAADVIAEVLPDILRRLPFRRTMRWPQSDLVFARPVRRLTVLLGADVVPCSLAGCTSGREIAGHAFLDPSLRSLEAADLEVYRDTLREARVLVDMDERCSRIAAQVADARAEAGGAPPVDHRDDAALVEEVAGLVEWPQSLTGTFDERYLLLPDAVLVTSMAHHLRYFPVRGADGTLVNRFVSVTDREPAAAAGIRRGNERVLRARLYDASFFFGNDREHSLEDLRAGLDGVEFHRGLGSLREKSDHVTAAVGDLAATVGLDEQATADARRAAHLLKCDLLCEMVGEFPELQGVMGGEYARLGGESASVARALEAQYLPRGDWDPVLDDDVAALVSVAEKADSLVGYFSIGAEPTGSADPYGLRRHAIGLLRILATRRWPVSIEAAVAPAMRSRSVDPEISPRIHEFLRTRQDQEARSLGFVDYVDAVGPLTDLPVHEFRDRLEALKTLHGDDSWKDLVGLVERTGNMGAVGEGADASELPPEGEAVRGALAAILGNGTDAVGFGRRFVEGLAGPVGTLFEKVLVDDPEAPERSAALKALLHEVFVAFRDRLGDLRRLGAGARPPRG